MDDDSWVEDYYQRWLYDQDLLDRANAEMNEETIKERESRAY